MEVLDVITDNLMQIDPDRYLNVNCCFFYILKTCFFCIMKAFVTYIGEIATNKKSKYNFRHKYVKTSWFDVRMIMETIFKPNKYIE